MKGETDRNTTVGNFKNSLSTPDRSSRHKINHTFEILRENDFKPEFIYPDKPLIKDEGRIKTLFPCARPPFFSYASFFWEITGDSIT